ncbi:MAG: hypothetical protein ACRD2R_02870 [Terriglobales bacterium]
MPVAKYSCLLVLLLVTVEVSAAKCIPIEEAPGKIGDEACVRGTVVAVTESKSGTWFLNFCKDYQTCPFSIVVFARDRKDVGDARLLQGKTIEIFGKIRKYQGRTEIILRESRQLRGEAAKLPPPPAAYDASRRGRNRARAPYVPAEKQPKRATGRPSVNLTPDTQPPPDATEEPEPKP